EADVFRVTLDPGNVVTFVGEQSHKSLPRLSLWDPEAYKDYVNSYTFFRGIVLGIAGLLALFLVILFVVKGAAMFPAAALLAWSVLAYLAIDFGFMGRLFDIPTTYEPIWRAVAEVVFSASILILLFTYLTLHRWHVRYLHASGIWLIFLFAVLGVALYDPSLGAGIARLSMVVTSVAGFGVILYLAFTGFDRAIMLIPTWILLLLWLLASGSAVAGLLDNDLVQPALSGGLVLLVLLFCFTIMQHAFSGGILAQGIVSDSERRALAIVGSGDMVWDWDVPRDRIHTSRDTERVLGLKRGALDGHARDWVEFLHTQDKDRFSSMLDAIIEQRRGRVNQDFRLRAEDGHYRWFKLRARPVVGTDGEVVRCVGTLLDITEQRTAEARLLHDAVHDNLTGLANRELLQDRLDAAMVRTIVEGAAKPAILLVDIDNFRNINDTFGLSIGDSILLTVARRLSRLLKPQDSIARFYGDQFAIILISEQQPERIAVFADSVRKALKIPIVFGDRELSLSVSIGIAIQDIQAHKTAADVINDSELALYHSKRMGGDRIEPFRPSLRQQGRGRSSLDKDLVAALDRNEIEVVFQPIVDLNSRMIKGFEALARWNHPQRGAVPPSDFIPAAERTGLIVPLGLHIMEQAARQLNQWQQKLKGTSTLFMSVNVSSQQLLRHDLIHDVKTILSRCDVNPGTLKLELTESLVMANPEYASQVLDKLRALGAGLSLDDFGTGYSSLSYLQHFPFDTLKIDRSFVGHEQGATPIILQSIVKLAQDLQLNLVAEGIESEDAVNQLTAMGCPMGQGYLFGKPLVPEEAHAMLTKQLEQSQRMQDEAQARRQLAEMEAAARKADEQRKIKEEQRRKEAAELERAQSHAREVAAQPLSTPEVKKPLAQRAEAAKQDPKQDTLEAQLAAGLALDLGDENVPSSDHASAKPDVMSVSNQGNGKFHAAVQTNDDETDGGDLLADLDMALENAIGAAAAEAIAETTPTKDGFVRDLTNAEAPVSRAPQNHGASNTPPQRLPAGDSAKQSAPKTSLRDKVGTASGLFLNSFKNKKAPNKFLKKLSGITAQNPAQTRDPASA
ncbi:EAL domain-containing protein, partial [Cohaesibacter celericrescens]|uniref:EAL domain-containing protein n=1 Tax=Cohaesibacter celericrescens TaxID=2067669 RepID=UPI003566C036